MSSFSALINCIAFQSFNFSSPAMALTTAAAYAACDWRQRLAAEQWWVDRAIQTCMSVRRNQLQLPEARLFLMDALDHLSYLGYRAAIYECWILEELRHGNVRVVRALFGEWRDHGGGAANAGFWRVWLYIEDERIEDERVAAGGGAAAREVAEAALKAFPRDADLYADYAKMELRRGHRDRAVAVLGRAMAALDSYRDRADRKRLLDKVLAFHDAMRAKTLASRLHRAFKFFFCLL